MKHFLIVFVTTTLSLFSLETDAQRKCYSNEYLKEQLAAHPEFAEKRKQIELLTEQSIAEGLPAGAAMRGTAVYNIPVVVHVVYNSTAQNITDAQVQSQINVLNNDYQLNNSDTGLVPAAFRPLVADCRIQFCLAKRDPNNAGTTGIVRKQTSVAAFTTNDDVKKNVTGGDDAWNTSAYLNIWVCNLSNSVLGYSQFPGGPAATDGVVIHYTAFGTSGTAVSPYNLGRTTTHEVGHWLNLYHISGDDGTGCTGTDNVGDTPNQAGQNFGCPVFPRLSCDNGPNGDMFMNYMDYVNDRCMQMFTLGQRDRMYAILQSGGPRASLATSQGCVAPAATTCGIPANLTAGSITQTSATISWGAVSGATTYTLQYKPTATTTYKVVTGIKSISYGISALTAGTSYDYKVAAVCGTTTGIYTALQNFITQVSTTCTNSYEPNNTLGTPYAINPKTNIYSQISTKTDLDYFSVSNSATQTNITVNLTNLPADYDMKLYSPTGVLLKTAATRGTTSETIAYPTTTVGAYTINIYGYNGVYNTTKCYTLNVTIGDLTVRNARLAEDGSEAQVKVYPSPAFGNVSVTATGFDPGALDLSIINSVGTEVRRTSTIVAGLNSVSKIDLSLLPSGLYFIKARQGKISRTERVYIRGL